MSYKDSLLLPNTTFPMKANLATKEIEILTKWAEMDIYKYILREREGSDLFVLHDGPPYANGHIHMGHVINKILKDIVVKSKSMMGYKCVYIPGWDCHGLPIEHNVEKEIGKKKKALLSKPEIRLLCREYAKKFINIQKMEFQRLGVFGDWNNPYLTMDFRYEADTFRELTKFVDEGLVYKEKKPVFWCPSCKTALALAEIEYQEDEDPSIYVKFDFISYMAQNDKKFLGKGISAIIWTTTPWTIPANMVVSVHPDFDYAFVDIGERSIYLVAEKLVEDLMRKFSIKDYNIVKTVKGRELEGIVLTHPIYDRESNIVLAEHVTLDAGTGLVHTAPGHGDEDYVVGKKYNVPIYSPVDDDGKFLSNVEFFSGIFVFDSNEKVIETLRSKGMLVKREKIVHSYPHCWRCKSRIIFRSTEQWFISIDKNGLREKSLREIDRTQWIPGWGRNRIYSMVESRPDWCISRQRSWGVPIAFLKCKKCGKIIYGKNIMERVAKEIEQYGSDIWFEKDAKYFLAEGYECECGSLEFEKEEDILDVWFDSGSSHAAVLLKRDELKWPADMYLEGSDQHRGWFHSSLLESVGTRGKAPYKAVLTHGFVVDAYGKKMSKSLGNVISPDNIIKRYGAEMLRLWVSATNYKEDIRLSDEIMKRLIDSYRKIRNTIRFLMGNLTDFDELKTVNYDNMEEIDRWILAELELLKKKLIKTYDEYEFHLIYQYVKNFCIVTLSSFYLDILKDRLYCDAKESNKRRSAQTAMNEILDVILTYLSPILSFTTEEAYLNFGRHKNGSIHAERFIALKPEYEDIDLLDKWSVLRNLKSTVDKALEIARGKKLIGNSLEADIYVRPNETINKILESISLEELADICIVSHVYVGTYHDIKESYKDDNGINIGIALARGNKCERCWKINENVGKNIRLEPICKRCYNVLYS